MPFFTRFEHYMKNKKWNKFQVVQLVNMLIYILYMSSVLYVFSKSTTRIQLSDKCNDCLKVVVMKNISIHNISKHRNTIVAA